MAEGTLKGRRALVTGASSGIGLELARQLARRGADLVLTARREQRLNELAAELKAKHGVDVRVVAADLAAPGAAEAIYARTEGEGLAVDILVNNAGLGSWKAFADEPWETLAGLIQVNVTALTRLTHLFVPRMVSRGRGNVMNVASIGAFTPTPWFAVYTATKAYVLDFTEALDHELKGTGVRACCVCPGGTATEFLDTAGQKLKSGRGGLLMPADRCAEIAVDKMLAGRRTVVTGFTNALGMWLLRFLPRRWIPAIADRAMRIAVEPQKDN
jgi:short-subunit dehydrogenase